jgi:hypothetical protein
MSKKPSLSPTRAQILVTVLARNIFSKDKICVVIIGKIAYYLFDIFW